MFNQSKKNLHQLFNLTADLTERLYRVLKKHPTLKTKDALSNLLGCSRSMLFHYETGRHPAPEQVLNKLAELEIVLGISDSTHVEPKPENSPRGEFSSESPGNPQRCGFREIPVIGWAHAGQAASYEEMPIDWQRMIPTDCRDPKAFAVTLEGDSMETRFWDGDMLVLMPSERIHNGCLAVIRLASDGVLLRRVEVRGERLRLVPLNPRYEAEEMSCDQISWAYPVWGSWSQVWK